MKKRRNLQEETPQGHPNRFCSQNSTKSLSTKAASPGDWLHLELQQSGHGKASARQSCTVMYEWNLVEGAVINLNYISRTTTLLARVGLAYEGTAQYGIGGPWPHFFSTQYFCTQDAYHKPA